MLKTGFDTSFRTSSSPTLLPHQWDVWAGLWSLQGCSATCDTDKIIPAQHWAQTGIFTFTAVSHTVCSRASAQHQPGIPPAALMLTQETGDASSPVPTQGHLCPHPGAESSPGLSHLVAYSAVSRLEAWGWKGYPEALEYLLVAIFAQPAVFIFIISMAGSGVVCVWGTWNTPWSLCLSPGPALRLHVVTFPCYPN